MFSITLLRRTEQPDKNYYITFSGSDMSSGEEVFSYMQPFPPQGTGFHRFAFVLYKQEAPMDVSTFKHDKEIIILVHLNIKIIFL